MRFRNQGAFKRSTACLRIVWPKRWDLDVKHYGPGSATISIVNLKEKIAQCPTSRRKSGTVAKEVKSHPTGASVFIY